MFWISQSLIKKFYGKYADVEHCPHREYRTTILGDYENDDSKDKEKGRYFETIHLGAGAFGSQEDMTRLRNGNKSADQKRIDELGLLFRKKMAEHNLSIHEYNTQIHLRMPLKSARYDQQYGFEGHIDIFPTPIFDNGELALTFADLKLAKSIYQEFGPYPWGNPFRVDTLQMVGYHTLIRNIDNDFNDVQNYPPELLDFAKRGLIRGYYLIFGYGDYTFKLMEVEYDGDKILDFGERLRKTMSLIDMYTKQDWPKTPGKVCHKCPVKDCEMQGKTLKL